MTSLEILTMRVDRYRGHRLLSSYIYATRIGRGSCCVFVVSAPAQQSPSQSHATPAVEAGKPFSYVQTQMRSWLGFGIPSADTADYCATGASPLRHLWTVSFFVINRHPPLTSHFFILTSLPEAAPLRDTSLAGESVHDCSHP